MRKWLVVAVVTLVVIVVGAFVWLNYLGTLSALKHETSRWAVMEDVNGNRMAVEPSSDQIWLELVQLNQNGTRMFVGGIVERYSNKWGFRFKPDTVRVASVTAEGLQATIKYISENLDYWLNGWAYVSAKVVEVHS